MQIDSVARVALSSMQSACWYLSMPVSAGTIVTEHRCRFVALRDHPPGDIVCWSQDWHRNGGDDLTPGDGWAHAPGSSYYGAIM